MATQIEEEKGITSIEVENFKSIKSKSKIDIKPITLLAGANSSGKSSIMQPLLLLKQTAESAYETESLMIYGPNIKYMSPDEFLCTKSNTFSIKVNSGKDYIKLNYIKDPKEGSLNVESQEIYLSKSDKSYILRSNMSSRELEDSLPENYKNMPKFIFGPKKKNESYSWSIVQRKGFLSPVISQLVNGDIRAKINPPMEFMSPKIYSYFSDVIYIPGFRGTPERSYKNTSERPPYTGGFHDYFASIILSWQKKGSKKLNTLNEHLKDLGLTSRVKAGKLNEAQVAISVNRSSSEKEDLVSIADVGFGVSQVMPILVAVLIASPGQIIHIEQPELHLHPRAQVALSKILMKYATSSKIKIVIETHSELILREIQTAVAEEIIDKSNVALHWFSRNKRGYTEIQTADLGNDGSFGKWPEDFGDISLESERRYISAVTREK